jgi:hypothetical protein
MDSSSVERKGAKNNGIDRHSKRPQIKGEWVMRVYVNFWRSESRSASMVFNLEILGFLGLFDSSGVVDNLSSISFTDSGASKFSGEHNILWLDVAIGYSNSRTVEVLDTLSHVCEDKLSNLLTDGFAERGVSFFFNVLRNTFNDILLQGKRRSLPFDFRRCGDLAKVTELDHQIKFALRIGFSFEAGEGLADVRMVVFSSQYDFFLRSDQSVSHLARPIYSHLRLQSWLVEYLDTVGDILVIRVTIEILTLSSLDFAIGSCTKLVTYGQREGRFFSRIPFFIVLKLSNDCMPSFVFGYRKLFQISLRPLDLLLPWLALFFFRI